MHTPAMLIHSLLLFFPWLFKSNLFLHTYLYQHFSSCILLTYHHVTVNITGNVMQLNESVLVSFWFLYWNWLWWIAMFYETETAFYLLYSTQLWHNHYPEKITHVIYTLFKGCERRMANITYFQWRERKKKSSWVIFLWGMNLIISHTLLFFSVLFHLSVLLSWNVNVSGV